MLEAREIHYDVLIDRLIKDFRPARRLWPVGARLTLWILLETCILALCAASTGLPNLLALTHEPRYLVGVVAFILSSVAAAFLALRSAIPGRESTPAELLLLATAVFGAASIVSLEPPASAIAFAEFLRAGFSMPKMAGLAALPWLLLFWAVRRGIPLHPPETGALIGVAAFCFASAAECLISQPSGFLYVITWRVLPGILVTVISALAGAVWLNPARLWRENVEARPSGLAWPNERALFQVALAASVASLIFVLKTGRTNIGSIPDFDIAIETYERSLTSFRPNVPSSSVESVLTAYIEHGMPSYMWDFGPEGFKLVGGRFDRLSDGTPVTYTWFRGAKGAVMCMFRRTDRFNPPSAIYEEHHHLLFYEYRGFSVCLVNVGGYGNFIGVIAAVMPIKEFVPLVLTAAL